MLEEDASVAFNSTCDRILHTQASVSTEDNVLGHLM